MSSSKNPPEIIAIGSGKGGTGKTLIGACLGYALLRAGHSVLLIDSDTGTDGLSLFVLGPKGMLQVNPKNAPGFSETNTFLGALTEFTTQGRLSFEPQRIERSSPDDQKEGASYPMLISSKGLYGDTNVQAKERPVLSRDQFRAGVLELFRQIRESRQYDYVIVDTRGGFSFESTDVCAAADSFLLVTDADYTSFFQDRNLVARISDSAKALDTRAVLRAIVVNRADGEEKSFRQGLEKEFGIPFSDTYVVPLDIEAMRAYKIQQIPYVGANVWTFAHATLSVFAEILHFVTAQWPADRVKKWNDLVGEVSKAIARRNDEIKAQEAKDNAERIRLVDDNARMQRELAEATGRLSAIREMTPAAPSAMPRIAVILALAFGPAIAVAVVMSLIMSHGGPGPSPQDPTASVVVAITSSSSMGNFVTNGIADAPPSVTAPIPTLLPVANTAEPSNSTVSNWRPIPIKRSSLDGGLRLPSPVRGSSPYDSR